MSGGFVRGPYRTQRKMGELLDRLRDEKPRCRVCDRVCDPDLEPGVDLIMVALDEQGDVHGLIPVHRGACKAEASARLKRAQAALAN